MSSNFFVGPTPPYNNPPINPQYFQPSVFTISAVTLGQTTTVTATKNMNYSVGQLVRFIIPPSFGCVQLNEVTGYVISLPASNQIQVAIDTSKNFDPYIASSATTQAQIVAVGSINSGIVNTNGPAFETTFIPGSFINISPN